MRRITAILVAFALVLAANPSTALGHTEGQYTWINNNEYTYNHFVRVCDVGYPSNGSVEARIIDALNEWNERGGELSFAWNDITDAQCDYEMGYSPLPWMKISHIAWSDTRLGWANTQYVTPPPFPQMYNCAIWIDDNGLTYSVGHRPDIGAFNWYFGSTSPGASEVDFESVLVHEIGHCLSRLGHSPDSEGGSAIMYRCLDPNCGDPRGDEKDEVTSAHDKALYTDMYGSTH